MELIQNQPETVLLHYHPPRYDRTHCHGSEVLPSGLAELLVAGQRAEQAVVEVEAMAVSVALLMLEPLAGYC